MFCFTNREPQLSRRWGRHLTQESGATAGRQSLNQVSVWAQNGVTREAINRSFLGMIYLSLQMTSTRRSKSSGERGTLANPSIDHRRTSYRLGVPDTRCRTPRISNFFYVGFRIFFFFFRNTPAFSRGSLIGFNFWRVTFKVGGCCQK